MPHSVPAGVPPPPGPEMRPCAPTRPIWPLVRRASTATTGLQTSKWAVATRRSRARANDPDRGFGVVSPSSATAEHVIYQPRDSSPRHPGARPRWPALPATCAPAERRLRRWPPGAADDVARSPTARAGATSRWRLTIAAHVICILAPGLLLCAQAAELPGADHVRAWARVVIDLSATAAPRSCARPTRPARTPNGSPPGCSVTSSATST